MHRYEAIKHESFYFSEAAREVDKITRCTPFYKNERPHFLNEISQRMPQLQRLHDLVLSGTVKATNFGSEWYKLGSTDGSRQSDIQKVGDLMSYHQFESILFAESFYLIAFRVFDTTRKISKQLEVPRHKPEPIGVRDLRNHMFAHPEKKLGKKGKHETLSTRFFKFSDDGRGVVMGGSYENGETPLIDLGFEKNCDEFRKYLLQWANGLQVSLGFP